MNFVAVREHNASGTPVLDVVLNYDPRDRSFGANFRSGFAGCAGDRILDGARAAARESPGAESAVDFAHVVMQQNVGCARRAHAEKRADYAGG